MADELPSANLTILPRKGGGLHLGLTRSHAKLLLQLAQMARSSPRCREVVLREYPVGSRVAVCGELDRLATLIEETLHPRPDVTG